MNIQEIEDSPTEKIDSLWLAITQIEAQEQLKQMTIADWPNMKKAARTKLHKELHSQAYPSELRKKNYITPEQLQKVLGR
jgi:hypothetical protein